MMRNANYCDEDFLKHEVLSADFINWRHKRSKIYAEKISMTETRSDIDIIQILQKFAAKYPKQKVHKVGYACEGGRVKLNLGEIDADFYSFGGPKCRASDVNQLLGFYLDRLLGLFLFPTCVARKFTAVELEQAGFPVDSGGDRYDSFNTLKDENGDLSGVICIAVDSVATTDVFIPKFNNLVGGITEFDSEMRNQLEYFTISHLLGLDEKLQFLIKPRHSIVDNLTGEKYFIHKSSIDVFSSSDSSINYFYNCVFSQALYERINQISVSNCDLGNRIKKFVFESYSGRKENFKNFEDLVINLNKNVLKLTQVLKVCSLNAAVFYQ